MPAPGLRLWRLGYAGGGGGGPGYLSGQAVALAAGFESVALLRPCAMTHHTDAGQRYVKLGITGRGPNSVRVPAPANGNIAPPGYYMLFIVTADGVPSVAQFIRLS